MQPQKTPISMLQELCTKRGLTPKYDVVAVEGAVHEPTFVYRVQVGEMVAQVCFGFTTFNFCAFSESIANSRKQENNNIKSFFLIVIRLSIKFTCTNKQYQQMQCKNIKCSRHNVKFEGTLIKFFV